MREYVAYEFGPAAVDDVLAATRILESNHRRKEIDKSAEEGWRPVQRSVRGTDAYLPRRERYVMKHRDTWHMIYMVAGGSHAKQRLSRDYFPFQKTGTAIGRQHQDLDHDCNTDRSLFRHDRGAAHRVEWIAESALQTHRPLLSAPSPTQRLYAPPWDSSTIPTQRHPAPLGAPRKP